MSNYAQIITGFERAGNFPLEANYIFPTVEALKEFYSDEIQAATLHKGLLKVVESNDSGKQALYWVTKKATNDELEFTELVAGNNITEITESLNELLEKLTAETTARQNADTALWGLNDPSNIDEDYNSINDLANQVKALQTALSNLESDTVSDDDSLKNQLKAAVGTTDNDIQAYLNTLPYKSITELAEAVNALVNPEAAVDTTDIIDTIPEITAFLAGYTNKDTLANLLNALWNKIEGDTLPSQSFRTLRGVEDYLIEYKTANDYKQNTLLEELNNIETAVGLNAEGSYTADSETYYLTGATSIMNALQILDKTLHTYVSANVPSVRDTDEAVKLTLTQELDSYVLAATLKLSTQAGNQLIKNTDGLYSCAKTYYENGVLTFKVNDNIVSQHYIGMSAIVQSAKYDSDNEQLVFVFKLDSGDTQEVVVPVGALIREWEPYNADTSPIVLERYESVSGIDQLAADVRLSTSQFNILEKDGNTLYVKGTTDNLYHGGTLLSEYLSSAEQNLNDTVDSLLAKITANTESITTVANNLKDEISTRTSETTQLTKSVENLEEAVSENSKNITSEATARKDADTTLQSNITAEQQRATTAENRLQLAIDNESDRAKQVETEQATVLQSTVEKLSDEITRSVAVDQELANKISSITHPEYTVVKQGTPETGYAATYIVTKDGVQTGDKINIPEQPSVSAENGNQILAKQDGFYMKVRISYEDGVFSLLVNDSVVDTFNFGLSSVVSDSYYDSTTEELAFVFNLQDGTTQTVRISVHGLIQEWETSNENHTVTLTKTIVTNGPDKLSADVNISKDVTPNILQKDDNGLYVKGTADNITTDSGSTVQEMLNNQQSEIAKKAPIDSPILTGVPQVETSPDDTDSSQRIPSTAWVKARLDEILAKAKEYADSLLAIEWIDVTDETFPETEAGTGWINVP